MQHERRSYERAWTVGQLRRQVPLVIFLAATAAAAQTTVTNNNDGASGTVPVYNGSATLTGTSPLSVSGSNVGIGTTAPVAPLEIDGGANTGNEILNLVSTGTDGYFTIHAVDGSVAYFYQRNGGSTGFTGSSGSSIDIFGGSNSVGVFNNNGDVALGGTITSHTTYAGSKVVINGSSGNVGIGTTTPGYTLDVAGQIHSSAGYVFPDGTTQTTAASASGGSYSSINQYNGNIGIGTTTPGAPLEIDAGTVSGFNQVYNALYLRPAVGNGGFGGSGSSLLLGGPTNHGIEPLAGVWSSLTNGGDGGVDYAGALVFGVTQTGQSSPSEHMRIDGSGNVGIGTTTPGATLEVNGKILLTANSGASLTFPDGTVQSTAWNGVLTGGDYAESVDVAGDRARYEPGDVLVIDTDSEGHFLKSAQPYSTSVTGIYSTRPGLVGRRQLTDRSHMKAEVPMAMTGIVPIKVSAENGPIKAGDLLVTSSTPGYAMKGTDRSQMLGAVIGKALGHLDNGLGVIEGVVTLQ